MARIFSDSAHASSSRIARIASTILACVPIERLAAALENSILARSVLGGWRSGIVAGDLGTVLSFPSHSLANHFVARVFKSKLPSDSQQFF